MNERDRLRQAREGLLARQSGLQEMLRYRKSPTPPYDDLPYTGGIVPGREESIDPFVSRGSHRVPNTVNPGHSKLYQVPVQEDTVVVGVSPPPPSDNPNEYFSYSSVPAAAIRDVPIFEYPPQIVSGSPTIPVQRDYTPTVINGSPPVDEISVIHVPSEEPIDYVPWRDASRQREISLTGSRTGRGFSESKQPSPRRMPQSSYNPSELHTRSATPMVTSAAVEQAAEAIFNSGVEYRASPARLETGTRNNINGNPILPHDLSKKKQALLEQKQTLEHELSGTESNMGRLLFLRDQGGDQFFVKALSGESIGIEFEEHHNTGVIITRIAPNSPADRCSIPIGGVIVGINNSMIQNGKDLRTALSRVRTQHHPPKDEVIIFDIVPPAVSSQPPLKKPVQRTISPARTYAAPPQEYKNAVDSDVLQLVVQKLNDLDNKTSHLTEMVSRQQKIIHEKPRFSVGTRVYCKISSSSWKPGVVVGTNWRGKTWPADKPSVPYQIRLDGTESLIFAPYDDDRIIRIREEQSVVYYKNDEWDKTHKTNPPSPRESSSSSTSEAPSSESYKVPLKTVVAKRKATAPVKHPCAGPSGKGSRPAVTAPRFTFAGKMPPASVRERDHPATPEM